MASIIRDQRHGLSTSDAPVEVIVGSPGNLPIKLAVPKAYLTWLENWNGGYQDFVIVDAVFPNMEPAAPTGILPGDPADLPDPSGTAFRVRIRITAGVEAGFKKFMASRLKNRVRTEGSEPEIFSSTIGK